MYCDPAWLRNVYGAGFQARVSAKNATRQPRRSRITGCSAMSRPKPEPTNRTPTRVSRRIVSSTAAGPPSHAWLLAVLTTSNPARASAAAAAEGAVKTPTESGAALESGSRTGGRAVAVEKLAAPPAQRPRRPVRNRAELRLGSRNVEPAQRHHDDVGRERRELLPGTGSRPLAWGAADVLAARERHELGNPVTGDVRRVEPFQHQYARFPQGRTMLRPCISGPLGLGSDAAEPVGT